MALFNTLVPTIPTKNIVYSSVLSNQVQSANTGGGGLHITTLDVTITASGTKPILLEFRSVASEILAGRPGRINFTAATSSAGSLNIQIIRGAAIPFAINIQDNLTGNANVRAQGWPPGAFRWCDTSPPAGVINYQVWIQNTNGTTTLEGLQFVATEVI